MGSPRPPRARRGVLASHRATELSVPSVEGLSQYCLRVRTHRVVDRAEAVTDWTCFAPSEVAAAPRREAEVFDAERLGCVDEPVLRFADGSLAPAAAGCACACAEPGGASRTVFVFAAIVLPWLARRRR